MAQYARVSGILIEPVAHLWAAFSPATGETTLLNDESASILEVLESGPADTAAISATLALDNGSATESMQDLIAACWSQLVSAGLVREQCPDDTMPR